MDGSHAAWLFRFVLPPFLGACIGYLTNAIAIRMLFRPFQEKRFFGLRIPFTPGIIPKYRFQLAENIGFMVSTELLSKVMLSDYLKTEDFKNNLSLRVEQLTASVLEKKTGEVLRLLQLNKGSFRISNEKDVPSFLDRLLSVAMEQKMTIQNMLPVNLEQIGRAIFLSLYPDLFSSVLAKLRSPDVRRSLEMKGSEFLDSVQHRLNFFQKLMINAGNYQKTLESKMPGIIHDLLEILENEGKSPETMGKITEAVQTGIRNWGEKPVEIIEQLFNSEQSRERYGGNNGILSMIFAYRHSKIGVLLGISEQRKTELDNLLIEKTEQLLQKNLENILDAMNIQQLVVNRINQLEIEDVERILLIIIEKHLTWINIFGAVIGALIGGVQILIRFL